MIISFILQDPVLRTPDGELGYWKWYPDLLDEDRSGSGYEDGFPQSEFKKNRTAIVLSVNRGQNYMYLDDPTSHQRALCERVQENI